MEKECTLSFVKNAMKIGTVAELYTCNICEKCDPVAWYFEGQTVIKKHSCSGSPRNDLLSMDYMENDYSLLSDSDRDWAKPCFYKEEIDIKKIHAMVLEYNRYPTNIEFTDEYKYQMEEESKRKIEIDRIVADLNSCVHKSIDMAQFVMKPLPVVNYNYDDLILPVNEVAPEEEVEENKQGQ